MSVRAALSICLLPPSDLTVDSGSPVYTRALAQALVGAGHRVTVVCSRPHPAIRDLCVVAPIPLAHPDDDGQGTDDRTFGEAFHVTLACLLERWASHRWDVIHSIYPGYNGLVASVAAALLPSASVISCLGRILNVAAVREPRYATVARLALGGAHGVVAATPALRDRLVREYRIPERRITVVHQPLDLAGFVPRPVAPTASASRPLSILVVASCVSEDKGIDEVLRAAGLLGADHARVTIVGDDPVAGRPYRRTLEALSHAVGCRAEFVGAVPHHDVARYLCAADVVVDARRVPNFSSAAVEALATATPLIASEAVRESLGDTDAALFFKSGDHHDLARQLAAVRDPTLAASLWASARRWSRQAHPHVGPTAHAERVARVYRFALRERTASPIESGGPP